MERTTPTLPISPPEIPAEAQPAAAEPASPYTKPPRHEDPTRFGDWELSGKCVDF